MKIKFIPLGERVLLKPDPVMEVTEKGVVIPETAREKPCEGKVVAVGLGKKDLFPHVRIGDRVLYNDSVTIEITIEKIDYIIINESEIYGILHRPHDEEFEDEQSKRNSYQDYYE